MTLDEFLARFPKKQRAGAGWLVRCPAHEDSHASLSVTERDGKILLNCHAGRCTAQAIVTALDLTLADLFVDAGAPRPTERRIVAEYNYENECGELLFQAVRFEPKGFAQRRPEGPFGGPWVWNLEGVRRVVYRLPELAEQRRVYLVEGEKDADALWAIGIPATTTPAGAAQWRDEYALQLKSAGADEVIILPDNDEPGLAYASKAAAALTTQGVRVRVLRLPGLPPKGDVSDWLDDGHDGAGLEALAATAPIRGTGPLGVELLGVGAGDFLRTVYPPSESFIEGVLSDDGGGWVGGEEKLAKTFYCLDETLALVFGLPVCGRFPVPKRRRVLFLEEEDSPRRTQRRLNALLVGRGFTPDDPAVLAELNTWFHLSVWAGFKFDRPEMVARLEATIATFEPAVVYIDVLRKVTLRDLNKQVEAAGLLDMLDDLRRRYGVLFRIIHHYRKSQGFRVGRGSQEIGGSYVFGAWGENSLFFEPTSRKPGAPVRVAIQSKDGAPEPAFLLRLEAEGPRHAPTLVRLHADLDKTEEDVSDVLVQAIAALPKSEPLAGKPGVPVAAIAAAVKKSEKTVRRALKRLLDADTIVVTGQAAKGRDLYGVV